MISRMVIGRPTFLSPREAERERAGRGRLGLAAAAATSDQFGLNRTASGNLAAMLPESRRRAALSLPSPSLAALGGEEV
jgi:hypothetical protein